MATRTQNTARTTLWRITLRDQPALLIEAVYYEGTRDGKFFVFGNGGSGVAAQVAVADVVSIVDVSGESS